jgi:hypothetical protein
MTDVLKKAILIRAIATMNTFHKKWDGIFNNIDSADDYQLKNDVISF